jgi:hypothetical protein
MILDDLMPAWDATRLEHRVARGEPALVFGTALHVDFLDVARTHPVVRALFAVRAAGERVVTSIAGHGSTSASEPPTMRLVDMTDRGEWVRLGQEPAREIAFGAIGRFWAGETVWQTINAAEFAAFDEPGFAKIACNLSFREYGPSRTLMSYEARTRAIDDASRAAFMRYWRVVALFVGVVMASTLRLIASEVPSPD